MAKGHDGQAQKEGEPAPDAISPARLTAAGFHYVTGARVLVVIGLVLSLSGAVLGAVQPLVLKEVFDALVDRSAFAVVLGAVALLAGVYLAQEIVQAFANWLRWKARVHMKYGLLSAVVERLHALPVSYHLRQSVGGTLTRLQRAIEGFTVGFDQLLFQTLPSILYLVVGLFFMVQLDLRLSLVVAFFAPMPALVGIWAAREQTRRERNLMDRWVGLYARFNEVLGGIVTVKSFSMEDREKRRFLGGVDEANDIVVRGVARDTATGGAQNLITIIARLIALGYGGLLVLRGEITIGTLVAFLGYLEGMFGPLQGLTGVYQSLRRGLVGLEVLQGILGAQDRLGDRPDAVELEDVRGHVTFEDVHFRYPEGPKVLDGIDLHVRAGEVVAFVGPSGSGKTTMTALLQRLYDPDEGRVLLDGRDLRDIRQRSLRRKIGVVSQDTTLFDDTVHDVIAYGRPGASRQEVEDAARAAQAHGFIIQLADGYDTRIGERGGRLSMGQRQRLSIARALLKDPRIVVLDEATSALDAESEAKVQAAVDRLIEGRTTFVVAHRLSVVVDADRILVLRDGRIHEDGSHASLLRADGYYAHLVRLQTAGLVDGRSDLEQAADDMEAGEDSG